VVEVRVLERPHFRIDIARDREIDEEEPALLARLQGVRDLLRLDAVVGRRRRGDDDVARLEVRLELLEAYRHPLEALREADRALVGLVRNEDLLHILSREMLGRQLAHLARAEEEDAKT